MGKVSAIFIFMLMANIIGYIALTDYVQAYPSTGAQDIQAKVTNNPLLALYTTQTQPDGTATFTMNNDSALLKEVPRQPDERFLSGVAVFIDRIFALFSWIRTIIAVAVFPITLISMFGLPWQLSMLLGIPLATLYIFGLIDIFSSSGT